METKHSAEPEAGRGGRLRRNWKRAAVAVVMAFVVFSVGRSILPALGIHLPGGRSHSPASTQPTTARSAPPPTVNLDDPECRLALHLALRIGDVLEPGATAQVQRIA